jgi:quercetin dioxygenase-like cupin family protein
MVDYAILPDLRRDVEVPHEGILSRTVFESDRIKAVLFAFDAGQELSEHAAAMPAIIEILDGEAEILLGADRHRAVAGAWVHMPAGLRHAVRATSPLTMLLLLLPDPEGVAAESR